MNWTTLYITGREGFQAEVRKKLAHSDLDFIHGYVDNATSTVDLYWISDETELRAVKEAIGSKVIWKYRLKFCTNLETFIQMQENQSKADVFTQDDLALMAHMRKVA